MVTSRLRPRRRIATLLAARAAALLAVAACALPAPALGALSPLPESDYGVRTVCLPPQPGTATCLSRQLVPLTVEARAHSHPIGVRQAPVLPAPAPANGNYGLRPADLHSAYQLPSSPPSTQTIAIVDAYNDPTAEQDLKAYSEEFGLPECTTANGCFKKVNQSGQAKPLPFPKTKAALEAARKGSRAEVEEAERAEGWALEISLDIETAHAVCQTCHILLVEAASPFNSDLSTAENTAVALEANEVSNSWGGEEFGGEEPAFNHPGVVITASAGDDGYLEWLGHAPAEPGFVEYPAASPRVFAVGGTRLLLGAGGSWSSETVWNDGGERFGEREGFGAGGGGCSKSLAAAAWQQELANWAAVGCGTDRAVADVSADADPYTGLAVQNTTVLDPEDPCTPSPHWCTIGGTSLASPIVAAVFALAGGAHGVSYPAQTLYRNLASSPAALHDVVVGSNGECNKPFNNKTGTSGCTTAEQGADCSSEAICLAGTGYDGPTGVGTPAGIGAFAPGAISGGGTGGGSEGGADEAGASPAAGSASAGAPAPGAGGTSGEAAPPAAPAPVLSALRLTWAAVAALKRTARRVSAVRFTFTLSAAARVTATLARGARVLGHWHFRPLGSPQAFWARRGSQRRHLSGRATLRRGRYRLTLTPAHGSPVSISFQVH
jgi:Subtilase family